MKKMLDLLSAEVAKAFAEAGYDEKTAKIIYNNLRMPGSKGGNFCPGII